MDGAPDRDGDGHVDDVCGGDDCDDDLADVHPGVTEAEEWLTVNLLDYWWNQSEECYIDGNREIGLSPDGAVHLACSGGLNELVYATNASGLWVLQLVAPGDTYDMTLAVATDASVHVAYHAGDSVFYATNVTGEWTIDLVGEMGVDGMGASPSLALGADDSPHIAYGDSDWNLHYATKDGGEWTSETVVSEASRVGSTSLGVATDGAAHISYRTTGGDLHHVTNEAGDWVDELLAVDVPTLSRSSLAVGADGAVHVAYATRGDDNEVRYATNQGGEWVSVSIGPADGGTEPSPSLAVAPDATVHIAYYRRIGHLQYATDSSGDWVLYEIADANGGPSPSLAAGSDGSMHIVHYGNRYTFRSGPDGIDNDCDGVTW